jgi:lipid-A-disaccharide synthase
VKIVMGQARQVMAAADVILLASGTATLEAMLMQRPMVVAYKIAPFTAWFVRVTRLINIRYFSMPNLLADQELVPEFLQEQVTGEALAMAVLKLLQQEKQKVDLIHRFGELGSLLRKSASDQAASAVADLLISRTGKAPDARWFKECITVDVPRPVWLRSRPGRCINGAVNPKLGAE